MIHIILGMIVMTKLILIYYLNIYKNPDELSIQSENHKISIRGFFRAVELEVLKRLCSPFLGWNTWPVISRLFLARVCLICSEEIMHDGDSTSFHSNLFSCLTYVVYANHRTFRDAERQLDACLFYLSNNIRNLDNFDYLGICDPDFHLLHICRSIC